MYLNILNQLAMPTIDFLRTETRALILQVALQSGPSDGRIERLNHEILTQQEFSERLLTQISIATRLLEQNNGSWSALATFSHLVRRILSLTSSDSVTVSCLNYLINLRGTCLLWLTSIESRVNKFSDYDEKTFLNTRAFEIALLGVGTFDVEEKYYTAMFEKPEAVSTLLKCSLIIRDSEDGIKMEDEDYCKDMLQSWRSLSYRSHSTLMKHVLSANKELNRVIQFAWAAFNPKKGDTWSRLSKPHDTWLEMRMKSSTVHFNVLNAELLVNGAPLTRIPTEYTLFDSYKTLFGKSLMEVGPSDQPGMRFCARANLKGFTNHFAINGSDLQLVAIGHGLRYVEFALRNGFSRESYVLLGCMHG